MAGATPAAPTWLDRQLIGGAPGAADKGFGGELREALRQRSDFLIEQSLAARRGLRLVLAHNLLGSLRQRDLDAAARGSPARLGCRTGRRWTAKGCPASMAPSGRYDRFASCALGVK